MNSYGITLISDNIKIIDTISCPLIFEVVSSDSFKLGKFNQKNNLIIDGYELSTQLFYENSNFLNHKIIDNVFWFYTPAEIEETKSYYTELKKFIFSTILNDIVKIKTIVVYKETQFENIKNNFFEVKSTDNSIVYLFDGVTIFLIDLNYFRFITGKKINSLSDLFDITNHKVFTFDDLKLKLKIEGLVDKTFNYNSFLDYFKLFDYNSDDNLEYYKWLVAYFYNILNYNSINKKITKNINSDRLNIFDLNKYNNFYENIIFIENYLSNIKIKNIDFNKFPELEFPIKNNSVQFTYNGSDTTTGRIYPTDLDSNQSLQTLNKEQRCILKADNNCSLIEFDYKSFEFDILCQLAGIPIENDPHINIVEYLFTKDFIKDDLIDYRALGKGINYSFIYGKNIDKIVEFIIETFFSEDDKKEMINNEVDDLTNYFKNKLESHWIVQAIKFVTDKIMNDGYFNTEQSLLTNYFGRFIRVKKKHALLNNFISSTASDFLYVKIRMIIDLLEKRKIDLSKNKILLQNHDSILLQLENKIIDNTDAFETINEIMEADINGLIGRVDFKYGKNWGHLK